MTQIKVNLGKRSYQIIIGPGALSQLSSWLKKLKLGQAAIVVTNPTINRLYGRLIKQALQHLGVELHFGQVADSEKSKSHSVCINLVGRLAQLDRGKGVFVIALGGGVVGDLAGFAAAIYRRGIPYIQVPTTLLAQVDSSIGGKVAIDLPCGKNLIGSFYQPRLVISDINLLSSLSKQQIRSGLAEIIKYAIIADKGLFKYLELHLDKLLQRNPKALQHVVQVCSKIKARIIEQDETDTKEKRMVLNFGHTAGHAIEAASGFSQNYPHGQAIALGMLVACEIARQLKMTPDSTIKRIGKLIFKAGLPTKISGLSLKDILQAQAHDKKFSAGKNRFVLPVAIGKVVVKEDIPQQVIDKAIKSRMTREKPSLSDYE
ncbi:MAG: 3-dehydroquinate synthase [Candidatus Omnitrophica bacterium]|nr:3-dehydroquinate synthase [Candidatus Omnitrophota bacterium]